MRSQTWGRAWVALTAALGLHVAACVSPSDATQGAAHAPRVSTEDVRRFVRAFHQIGPTDSTCAALDDYFREGSVGLRAYSRKFDVGRKEVCAVLRRDRERYAAIEPKLAALDSAVAEIAALLTKFSVIRPDGRLPGVYFVVGDGISGGTTTRGRDAMILIGMEANGAVSGLPWSIAHEFVHTQQDFSWMGALQMGPSWIRGTVLRHSIMEGSADLIAEVLTGRAKRNPYGEAHEAELWQDFRRDLHSKDYSLWLYNGRNVQARGERPPDLGYWMGYRVTKAYYEKAADKQRAIREILSIRDFDAFLAASGYSGAGGPPN